MKSGLSPHQVRKLKKLIAPLEEMLFNYGLTEASDLLKQIKEKTTCTKKFTKP